MSLPTDALPDDLAAYVNGQGALVRDQLRQQESNEVGRTPYPAPGNPMLAYLVDRARSEYLNGAGAGDLDRALWWLAATAWFEGALDRTADIIAADGDLKTLDRRPGQG